MHYSVGMRELRSLKCVFLGYPEGVKMYESWVKDSKCYKIIISQDVLFDKDIIPCSSDQVANSRQTT